MEAAYPILLIPEEDTDYGGTDYYAVSMDFPEFDDWDWQPRYLGEEAPLPDMNYQKRLYEKAYSIPKVLVDIQRRLNRFCYELLIRNLKVPYPSPHGLVWEQRQNLIGITASNKGQWVNGEPFLSYVLVKASSDCWGNSVLSVSLETVHIERLKRKARQMYPDERGNALGLLLTNFIGELYADKS